MLGGKLKHFERSLVLCELDSFCGENSFCGVRRVVVIHVVVSEPYILVRTHARNRSKGNHDNLHQNAAVPNQHHEFCNFGHALPFESIQIKSFFFWGVVSSPQKSLMCRRPLSVAW